MYLCYSSVALWYVASVPNRSEQLKGLMKALATCIQGKWTIRANIWGFCWRPYLLSPKYLRSELRCEEKLWTWMLPDGQCGEAVTTTGKAEDPPVMPWRPNVTVWVTTLCQGEQSPKQRWEWNESIIYLLYKQWQLAGQILVTEVLGWGIPAI